MGYLEQKYSTLAPFPWVLRLRERLDVKRAVVDFNRFFKIVHTKVPRLVKDHKVRAALSAQQKAVGLAEKAEIASTHLPVEVSMQTEQIMEIIDHLIDTWEKSERKFEVIYLKEPQNIKERLKALRERFEKTENRAFSTAIMKEMEWASGITHGHLYKKLLNIISEARHKVDSTTLMAEVRTFVQANPNVFSVLAARLTASNIRKFESKLKHESHEIKRLLDRLYTDAMKLKHAKETKPVETLLQDIHKIITQLEQDIHILEGFIHGAFTQIYNLLIRDFNIILLLEKNIDIMGAQCERFAAEKLMPERPEKEMMEDLATIKKKIEDHSHTIAQALNIVYDEEKQAAKKAAAAA